MIIQYKKSIGVLPSDKGKVVVRLRPGKDDPDQTTTRMVFPSEVSAKEMLDTIGRAPNYRAALAQAKTDHADKIRPDVGRGSRS